MSAAHALAQRLDVSLLTLRGKRFVEETESRVTTYFSPPTISVSKGDGRVKDTTF